MGLLKSTYPAMVNRRQAKEQAGGCGSGGATRAGGGHGDCRRSSRRGRGSRPARGLAGWRARSHGLSLRLSGGALMLAFLDMDDFSHWEGIRSRLFFLIKKDIQ